MNLLSDMLNDKWHIFIQNYTWWESIPTSTLGMYQPLFANKTWPQHSKTNSWYANLVRPNYNYDFLAWIGESFLIENLCIYQVHGRPVWNPTSGSLGNLKFLGCLSEMFFLLKKQKIQKNAHSQKRPVYRGWEGCCCLITWIFFQVMSWLCEDTLPFL